MIVELVTFRAPHGGDWDHILEGARGTIPKWSANPKLVRKHFLLSEDAQTCAGLYIWPSRADAEHAHNALWQDEGRREAVEAALAPIGDRLAAEADRTARRTAATKVNFFTMVRGED